MKTKIGYEEFGKIELIIYENILWLSPDKDPNVLKAEREIKKWLLDEVIPDTSQLSKKKTSAEFRKGYKYAVFQMKHCLKVK